jgi:hypothetical protein
VFLRECRHDTAKDAGTQKRIRVNEPERISRRRIHPDLHLLRSPRRAGEQNVTPGTCPKDRFVVTTPIDDDKLVTVATRCVELVKKTLDTFRFIQDRHDDR